MANPAVNPAGTRHLRGITHRELDDTQPDHQFVCHVPDDSFHDDLFLQHHFYYMEHGVNPPVKTYWDAFDWALMNVTTVGSNIFGVTKIGQILAVILAAAGMIFFPIFTAYVTTIFQRKRKETNGTADEQTAL